MAGLLGAAALIVGACGGEDTRYDYPEDAQDNFIAGCEGSSGGQTDYCECLLAEFQSTVPFEDFARIDREILEVGLKGLSPEDREQFQGTVEVCTGELES